MTEHPVSDASQDSSSAIRDAAAAAVSDVDALGLTGIDRTVALAVIMAKRVGLGGLAAPIESGRPASRDGQLPPPRDTSQGLKSDSGSEDLLGKVARKLGITREDAEMVYDTSEGDVTVILSPRSLPGDRANGARTLAKIVAAGRQAAELEDWTPLSIVRAVVTDFGKLDSANFSSSMNRLDDVARFRGKGPGREVKVTRPGFESIGELIKSLSGTT